MAITSTTELSSRPAMAPTAAFILFFAYMGLMGSIAVISYIRNKKSTASQGESAAEDTTHFLGQRNLGTFVMYFNIMASFTSGFLMVFVPDLSMAAGPGMICWMLVCNCFTYMATFIYPTLSRLGRGRNYLGPNDFTIDRYNSSTSRFISSFGGGFSAYMVLTIEWMILKIITAWLFGGTGNVPTWCLGVFILICESLGGMNSVALTDALQFMFMSFALLVMPMLIEYEYGGFMGGIFGTWGDECTRTAAGRVCTPTVALPLMNTFATTAGDTAGTGAERAARFNAFSPGMNCENHEVWTSPMNWTAAQVKADGPALGCLGCEMAAANFAFAGATGTMYTYYDTIGTAIVETATAAVGNTQMYHQVHSGCVAYTQAWWLMYPPKSIAVNYILTIPLGLTVFGLSPYAIHRIMVAEEDRTFKMTGFAVLTFPFIIMLPSIFLGLTVGVIGLYHVATHPTGMEDTSGAFTAMASIFAEMGGVPLAVSCFLMVSATASFMSTADSVIIALSNMWTQDFFVGSIQNCLSEGLLGGRAKQANVAGKIVSALITFTSIAIALYSGIGWLKVLNVGIAVTWAFLFPIYVGAFVPWVKSPVIIVTAILCGYLGIYWEFGAYAGGADAGPFDKFGNHLGGCTQCQDSCGPNYRPFGEAMDDHVWKDKALLYHQKFTDCPGCLESVGFDATKTIVSAFQVYTQALVNVTIEANHPKCRNAYPGVNAPPPMIGSTVFTAIIAIVSVVVLTLLMKLLELFGLEYDDLNKPWFMQWDSINQNMYKLGVVPDVVGARMLVQDTTDLSKWNVAEVTTVQAVGSETVECTVKNSDGSVIEKGKHLNVNKELRGLPWSTAVRDDLCFVTRDYYDTPFGTFLLLLAPCIFIYIQPLWKVSPLDCKSFLINVFGRVEYGWCGESGDWMKEKSEGQDVYEPIAGPGIPQWVNTYFWGVVSLSVMQWVIYFFLIRATDDSGRSIAGTEKDHFAKLWPLDLTWSELLKFGCRKRRDWAIDLLSQTQVSEWATANLTDPNVVKGMDGREANLATSPEFLTEDLEKLRTHAIAEYYRPFQHMPPEGTVPLAARVSEVRAKQTKVSVMQIVPGGGAESDSKMP